MKTALIVSEYNPFHLGHSHQINEIKSKYDVDCVISLLSGNFVQRGLPAILDKFKRSHLAILGGCNLVLELPTLFATSSAEFFSFGAISIADKLKNIDYISFGVENLNKDLLIKIATILNDEDDEYKNLLTKYLKEGHNFPKSRNLAVNKITNNESKLLMDSPNNILAIEYIKSLLKLNSKIEILPIKREGLGYHEVYENKSIDYGGIYPSATAVREYLNSSNFNNISKGLEFIKNFMPEKVFNEFSLNHENLLNKTYEKKIRELLYYKLAINGDTLFNLPESLDGLGERILNNKDLLNTLNYEDFIRNINTRRFTNSRIKRLLLHFLLGFEGLNYKADRTMAPNEARILALDKTGKEYLKSIKKISNINLRQSLTYMDSNLKSYEIKSNYLYSILNPNYKSNLDYINTPLIL